MFNELCYTNPETSPQLKALILLGLPAKQWTAIECADTIYVKAATQVELNFHVAINISSLILHYMVSSVL